MASTRSDLIPHEILAELTMVQHDVRPVGFNEVCAQVERYLGASLDETGTPTRKVDVRACRADVTVRTQLKDIKVSTLCAASRR